jgi:hypothetical protein
MTIASSREQQARDNKKWSVIDNIRHSPAEPALRARFEHATSAQFIDSEG